MIKTQVFYSHELYCKTCNTTINIKALPIAHKQYIFCSTNCINHFEYKCKLDKLKISNFLAPCQHTHDDILELLDIYDKLKPIAIGKHCMKCGYSLVQGLCLGDGTISKNYLCPNRCTE